MEILSKIKNIPTHYIVYLFVVVLLLASIIYVYKQYVAPKIDGSYVDNNEFNDEGDDNGSSGYAEMTMFHVDWCPHCKNSLPTYDEFASKYNGKVINGYKLKVVKLNCTDDEDPQIKSALDKYNIEGYPTITLSKNGELISFDAQPEMETLEQFVNEVLNN
jgi:thiol-disulfide isomerase/thioredoxin